MKNKKSLKKTIDPAMLQKILGGVPPGEENKEGTIIPQEPFNSFFHS